MKFLLSAVVCLSMLFISQAVFAQEEVGEQGCDDFCYSKSLKKPDGSPRNSFAGFAYYKACKLLCSDRGVKHVKENEDKLLSTEEKDQ